MANISTRVNFGLMYQNEKRERGQIRVPFILQLERTRIVALTRIHGSGRILCALARDQRAKSAQPRLFHCIRGARLLKSGALFPSHLALSLSLSLSRARVRAH